MWTLLYRAHYGRRQGDRILAQWGVLVRGSRWWLCRCGKARHQAPKWGQRFSGAGFLEEVILEVILELTPKNTMRVRLRGRNWKRGTRDSHAEGTAWKDAGRSGLMVGWLLNGLNSPDMILSMEPDPVPPTSEFTGGITLTVLLLPQLHVFVAPTRQTRCDGKSRCLLMWHAD